MTVRVAIFGVEDPGTEGAWHLIDGVPQPLRGREDAGGLRLRLPDAIRSSEGVEPLPPQPQCLGLTQSSPRLRTDPLANAPNIAGPAGVEARPSAPRTRRPGSP